MAIQLNYTRQNRRADDRAHAKRLRHVDLVTKRTARIVALHGNDKLASCKAQVGAMMRQMDVPKPRYEVYGTKHRKADFNPYGIF